MFETLLKSVINFGLINSVVYSFSFLSSKLVTLYNNSFVINLFTDLTKTFGLLKIMDARTSKKEQINSTNNHVITSNASIYNTFITTSIKSATHTLIISYMFSDSASFYPSTFTLFMIKSFVFEIYFDFFHYWAHRICHSNKLLYTTIHKKHHKYSDPTAYSSFYMTPLDAIFSYSLPLTFTSILIPFHVSMNEFMLMTVYLTYQEIGGHLGKKMHPTSSFCQFIWIPRIFSIELYTEDHHLHHKRLKYNFSKRFSLWDKVFNTYKVLD